MASQIQYTKLRSGAWGIKGPAGVVKAGSRVQVTKRSGETKTEVVAKVIWTDGSVAIAALGESSGSGGGGRERGRRTGCSCGSREDSSGELIPSPNNCRQCEFDAYDC
jgi:hypothetical protein